MRCHESRVRVLAQAQALCPEQFAQDEAALVARGRRRLLPRRCLECWPNGNAKPTLRLLRWRRNGSTGCGPLHLSKDWSGMLRLHGLLGPRKRSDCPPRPRSPHRPGQPGSGGHPHPCPGPGGCARRRSAAATSQGAERLPPPARVLVTIPWDTLSAGEGIVDTEAGPIGGNTARRLTCDATISRVLLDPESVPVEMGRATRVIPDRLRRLLELRDPHCTHPGCHIPARWCEAHHIVHWADGGRTDLANLRLLCAQHHTDTHQHNPHPQRE